MLESAHHADVAQLVEQLPCKLSGNPRDFTEIVESQGFIHESRGWSRVRFTGFGELN